MLFICTAESLPTTSRDSDGVKERIGLLIVVLPIFFTETVSISSSPALTSPDNSFLVTITFGVGIGSGVGVGVGSTVGSVYSLHSEIGTSRF